MNPKISVVGILVTGYGEVLVGKQKKDNNNTLSEIWCFPGGQVNDNETIEQALKREFKEETNIYVNNAQLICKIITSKGTHVYWYIIDEYLGEFKAGSDLIELKFVIIEELENMCQDAAKFWPKEVISILKLIKENKFDLSE